MNLKIKTTDKELFDSYKNNKKAKKIDLINKINGFYIELIYNNESVVINFESFLIVDNNKLQTVFINFSSSLNCPSNKLNLCPFSSECYSISDNKQYKGTRTKNNLNELFIKQCQTNKDFLDRFIKYCNMNKTTPIRFNKDGDFKDLKDFKFLNKVATKTKNLIGGYTKRTDIITDKELKNINFMLQISNLNYITTTDLKEYLDFKNKCSGYCNKCLKCYTNYKPKITLLHGALNKIDKKYNTKNNRQLLIDFFNKRGLKLTHELLTVNKGLLTSLNKVFKPYSLKTHKVELEFKNYKELIYYLTNY